MYIYQITNLINNKIYIGQTNNIKKRWSNHKNCNSPKMVIAKAIKKYGVENFKFEILLEGLTAEESDEAEVRLIQEKNSLVPNGYNVEKGGKRNNGISHYGADNSNAHLTECEAQYILDNRNIPMYILYDDFSEKITYEQFKKIYHHQTYQNLTSHSEEYPYNFEFSNQFTSTNKLDYDEVCKIRERYRNGEYWLKVYQDYSNLYPDKWTFWNIYYGNRYKLVMPEVFTEGNREKHSRMGRRGEKNGRVKLTEADVLRIRDLHKSGAKNSEIYKMYPYLTPTSVRDVINGKTWAYLL